MSCTGSILIQVSEAICTAWRSPPLLLGEGLGVGSAELTLTHRYVARCNSYRPRPNPLPLKGGDWASAMFVNDMILIYILLMIASVACTSEFEHRIYNRNLSAGCG